MRIWKSPSAIVYRTDCQIGTMKAMPAWNGGDLASESTWNFFNISQLESIMLKFSYFPHFSLFESSQSLFWASFGTIGLENFELEGIKSYTRFWGELVENVDWHNRHIQFIHIFLRSSYVWVLLCYQCYCVIESAYCHGMVKNMIWCENEKWWRNCRKHSFTDVELVCPDWATFWHWMEICTNQIVDVVFRGFGNTSAAVQVRDFFRFILISSLTFLIFLAYFPTWNISRDVFDHRRSKAIFRGNQQL